VIEKGEFVFLVGPSGSGKSTMIRLLLKELEPTTGRIIIGGRDLGRLPHRKVPQLRRNIGCVFQDFKLLSDRTTSENVAYALKVQGEPQRDRRKVPEVLSLIGLTLGTRTGRYGRRAAARLDRAPSSTTRRS
jgi:cell division transport system ATP-binding protein